jgi:hypothetical protein
MTALGVVVFLMVAGWQVGADGTQEVFVETEVALENAKAGSVYPVRWKLLIARQGVPGKYVTKMVKVYHVYVVIQQNVNYVF